MRRVFRMRRVTAWFIVLTVPVLFSGVVRGSGEIIIDDFDYASSSTAQAAWQAQSSSPDVQMAEDYMLMPFAFDETQPDVDRYFWDRTLDSSEYLDLGINTNIFIELYVGDPEALRKFTVYFGFESNRWAKFSFYPETVGWHTFVVSRHHYIQEGGAPVWDEVRSIRLSPWRNGDWTGDSELGIRLLKVYTPSILVVEESEPYSTQADLTEILTERVLDWMEPFTNEIGAIYDSEMDGDILTGPDLLIFPLIKDLDTTQCNILYTFVDNNGKLMFFSRIPMGVRSLIGITSLTSHSGLELKSMCFNDRPITYLPSEVKQFTEYIRDPDINETARAIAYWQEDGGLTDYAACIAHPNGCFMSDVLQEDDLENKRHMLLGLAGYYAPDIMSAASWNAIQRIGRLGPFCDYEEAYTAIEEQGITTPRADAVMARLAGADAARNLAFDAHLIGHRREALWHSFAARDQMLAAYSLCQSPVYPEMRAVWEALGTGPYPGDWEKTALRLKESGFNTVFMYGLSCGESFYKSNVERVYPNQAVMNYGDQVAAALDALGQQDIDLHLWKLCFRLKGASEITAEMYAKEGRIQVNEDLTPVPFYLCPSHPANQALEVALATEVVSRYENLAGYHLDYVRYHWNTCYCNGCRNRFENYIGYSISNWPFDVTDGELKDEYKQWRREQITGTVTLVSNAVRSIRPDIQVSVAVFPDHSTAPDQIGQDWVTWMNQGLIDLICPMNYTEDLEEFSGWVDAQVQSASVMKPTMPVIAGLGPFASNMRLPADQIISQIVAARELGAQGFVLFYLNRILLEEHLPVLGRATTLP